MYSFLIKHCPSRTSCTTKLFDWAGNEGPSAGMGARQGHIIFISAFEFFFSFFLAQIQLSGTYGVTFLNKFNSLPSTDRACGGCRESKRCWGPEGYCMAAEQQQQQQQMLIPPVHPCKRCRAQDVTRSWAPSLI